MGRVNEYPEQEEEGQKRGDDTVERTGEHERKAGPGVSDAVYVETDGVRMWPAMCHGE